MKGLLRGEATSPDQNSNGECWIRDTSNSGNSPVVRTTSQRANDVFYSRELSTGSSNLDMRALFSILNRTSEWLILIFFWELLSKSYLHLKRKLTRKRRKSNS
jgi:hypothetical protein